MNTFDFLLVFLTIEDSVLLTQRTATAALLGTTCSFIGRKKKKHANSLIWDLLKNVKYEGGRERLNVKQCFDYCENKQWWLILKCVELIQQISLSHVLFNEKMVSGEFQLSHNACWEVCKYDDHVCLFFRCWLNCLPHFHPTRYFKPHDFIINVWN